MPQILNNSVTSDTNGLRTLRLSLLSANIAEHAAVLNLAPSYLDWAIGAKSAWLSALGISQEEHGESSTKFDLHQELLDDALTYYQRFKDQTKALLADNNAPDGYYEQYGIDVLSPTNLSDVVSAVSLFKEAATILRAANSPFVPVPGAETLLSNKANAALLSWNVAIAETTEAIKLTAAARELFEMNSRKLRVIYTSAVVAWGPAEELLTNLGFVPIYPQGGGAVPGAPSTPRFNGSTTLEWDEMPGATSYGIAISTNGTVWQQDLFAPSNSETVPVLLNGKLWYKVRARNINGLSEFSGILERLFGLAGVKNFTFAGGMLTWNTVEFATTYQIERAVASTSVYTLLFNTNGTSFSDTPSKGNWTYRIRAVNGGIFGEWAELNVNIP